MRSSISSRPCNNLSCQHSSLALCNCCNQYLCFDHLKDHSAKQSNTQLSSLSTELNHLADRFHHISLVEPSFIKTLDKWRTDSYHTIDRFYESQRRHFEQFFQETREQQRKEIEHLRTKINDLQRDQTVTHEQLSSIEEARQLLEKDFNDLQHLQCNIQPLVIDENLASLRSNQAHPNLLPLSQPYRTMNIIDDSYCWMATNDKHFLVHQKPDLCLLDRQLSTIEKTPWTHGRIYVMCWSSTLNRFIVVTNDTIFTIDENLLTIERCDLTHQNTVYRNWRSGTCSNTNLFLATDELGSSVYELTLLPSVQFVKEWTSPIACRKDEGIDDLCYRNNKLAMVIFHQPTNETRLDLRSSTTLDTLWSIELGHTAPRRTTGCCSLNNEEWLVTDEYDFRLYHISENGHLYKGDKYHPAPYNALLFGKDILAIRTVQGMSLHRLR